MRRLFIKIFFWFWVAMALVWSAVLIPTQLNQNEELGKQMRALTDQRLLLSGRVAVGVVGRNGGLEAMRQFMSYVEEEGAPYPFVFDTSLQEITGRQPSPEAVRAAEQALGEGEVRVQIGTVRYAALRIVARNERTYAVVTSFPRVEVATNPFAVATQWLVVLAISGLVCYALARYLLGPVGTLSEATRALADGDLRVRVGDRLGRRHDELAGLGRDFDHMAERIGTLLDSQRQLLSDISHELRSPLARLYVGLGLARRKAGPEARESLDRIEKETERLNEMIGELLAVTRLEDPEAELPRVPIELSDLLAQVVSDADFEANARGKHVHLENGVRVSTHGHAELLRRAVENVLRNAVRYTDANTSVEARLRLDESHGTRSAVITVRDHGPGLGNADLERIFEPFYRVEAARDRSSGGAGLGLAISKRAVRAHGGHIEARNADGGGLEVEIRLPAG